MLRPSQKDREADRARYQAEADRAHQQDRRAFLEAIATVMVIGAAMVIVLALVLGPDFLLQVIRFYLP